MRRFYVGDKVYHSGENIIGHILRFYTPTSCAEQTLIRAESGKKYHAPTSEFETYKRGLTPSISCIDEYIGVDLAKS
jgi:hypothetical protein